MEENKEVDLTEDQYKKDFLVQVGVYIFKLSDINFIRLDPLDEKDESNKEHIKKGANIQILVYSRDGVHLAALCSLDKAYEIFDTVCKKINELIVEASRPKEKDETVE